MPDLERSLQEQLTAARKAQNKERTLLLGSILAAVRYRHLEVSGSLTDEDVLTVLTKEVKKRRESAEQYRAGGREELAVREEWEIGVLEEFLPPPADLDEVRETVKGLIRQGTVAMGPLMQALAPRYRGRVDGKVLSQIVREELPAK